MKKTWIIVWLPLLFAACAISDFEPSVGFEPQTVELMDSMGTVELTLSNGSSTRATTTVISKEEADNFLITIYKGSDVVREKTRLKDVNSRLPAGYGYIVSAENCTEAEAESANDDWGRKRFAGLSASFAIKAGETTAVNVGCSVANSGVEVVFGEAIPEYFNISYDITIQEGSRTLVFDKETAGKVIDGDTISGNVAYFNLNGGRVRSINYTIRAVGDGSSITKTGTLILGKSRINRINLNYVPGYFDFTISVEELYFENEQVIVHEEDIQTDDGATDVNATYKGYSFSNASVDIALYSQDMVSLSSSAAMDWAGSNASAAIYDITTCKKNFTVSNVNGQLRLSGDVTSRTIDFLAAYPYALVDDALSDGKILFSLPSEQRAVTDISSSDFMSSSINVSVAKGQRNYDASPARVTFQPVCQILQFQIPGYAANRIAAIQLSAASPLVGRLAVDYSGDSPSSSLSSSGSKSVTILPPSGKEMFAEGTYYILTAPVRIDGFTMSFLCEGTGYKLSSPTPFGGEAGKIYSLGYIDLVNTVGVNNAGHVYENNILQGTSFEVNTPIPSRNWSVTVKDSSGNTVRSFSGTGDFNSDYTDASWPYLPKGNYTVDYRYLTSNGKQMAGSTGINFSENPRFSVVMTAYTSFSYYKGDGVERDIQKANGLNNVTIFEPKVSIAESVDARILSNSHYSFSVTNNFNGTLSSSSMGVYRYSNYTVSKYSAYTLSATVTFDGASWTGSKTVYITGIPYTANPPTNTDWSGKANKWNNDYVRLHNHTITKSFYVPENVSVRVRQNVSVRHATVGTTYTLSCSGTELSKIEPGYMTTQEDGGSYLATMTVSNPAISCDNSYGNPASLFDEGTHTKVRSIIVQYRE